MQEQPKHPISDSKWLFQLMKPYQLKAIFIFFLVLVRSILLLCPPLLTRYLIDDVLPFGNGGALIVTALLIVSVPVITGVMIIVELRVSTFILQLSGIVRSDILNGLQHRPICYFQNSKSGDLLQRALEDTKSVALFGYSGFSMTVWYLLTTVIGIVMMGLLDWRLTLAVVVLLFIQTLLMGKLGNVVKEYAKDTAAINSQFMEQVREVISGFQFVKINGVETRERQKLSGKLDEHFASYRRFIFTDAAADFIQVIFVGLINGVLYLWGGLRVISGDLSVGSMVALAAIYVWVQPAFTSYFIMYIQAKRMIPLVSRFREILYPVGQFNGTSRPQEPVSVEFQNVNLCYGEKKVLDSFSIRVPGGRSVAVVGPSGAGKSTISDLLLRLLEPDDGKIRLSGIPLQEVDPGWLRQNVRCISQDVQLRSGTLLKNIEYMNSNATAADIEQAIDVCDLKNWVDQLPSGLLTDVGEDGLEVSGGERQRISIVHAILSKPAVIIFDEATSALDNLTEQKVIQNLTRALPNTTFIWITHRTSVLNYVDEIYTLDQGRCTNVSLDKYLTV